MQIDGGDRARDAGALERALDEALADLEAEDRGPVPETVDYRWLGIGLRLGTERPGRARDLLAMIDARDAEPMALPEDESVGFPPGDEAAPGGERAPRGEAAPGSGPGVGSPEGSGPIPVASSLLARSAALSSSDRAAAGPEVVFGWAARLTPHEILGLGRTVQEMVAAGGPSDVGRGFGLAWDAGVRIPRDERSAMFGEFTELELTVGSVLAGRDLRAVAQPARPQGLGALLGQLVPRGRPEESEAAAALDASGEPGRRGLVALWNAWVAMRYRTRIPQPTFELLVRPWVTVVGPLPVA